MGFWEAIGTIVGGAIGGALAVVAVIVFGSYSYGKGLIAGLSSASMSEPNSVKAGEWGTWTVAFTTNPSGLPLGVKEGDYNVEVIWDPAISDPTSGPVFKDGQWRNVYSGSHSSRITFTSFYFRYLSYRV